MNKADTRTEKALDTASSKSASEEIAKLIPGGVNSPFRSFHEVGGHTIFFNKAQGSILTDLDGNTYIDYLGAWGPAILGHSHASVVKACQDAVEAGAVFGAPTLLELQMAKSVIRHFPSIEQIRFVNSGTEAVMSAIRLARGFTGKNIVVMFEGAYHGHSDSVLGSTTHQSSTGLLEAAKEQTVLTPFNDLNRLEATLRKHADATAAVIIEPVCGSMGVVLPEPGFLQGVRKLCDEFSTVLIFDEVLTGLRVAKGGAQALYGVRPDITTFGKALGGGMPIGAYGGRRDIMDALMPIGAVYQAGTFSGNPVTMAGGIEVLRLLDEDTVYETLDARSAQLFEGIGQLVKERSLPIQLQRAGSMFAIIFNDKPVRNFDDSKSIDAERFAKFFHHVLNQGIYLPPSAVDAACVSAAHTEQDIDMTIEKMTRAFKQVF
ncbi:MAG: glutamate-1-semialdehyde-2,1-aminomutase [Cyanobacteria bacterium PR.3.49]|nr:glutamate-1-semialdehyde-2,1-aminomutase [Cyanobacteria bacterium PR.3.49]